MTPEQYKNWKSLIEMCKSNQNSINVGSDRMRNMLIAVDDFLQSAAMERVEERKAAIKAELLSDGESLL